ncbi:hypothetical protein CDL12_11080 [Handroanthus impetiginosus]|uniref:H15 domain-containing protein n=1 Tax=Handroanthus impetiginosus TaxID=429701 RepID=A0A2G9HFE9_9LAMI|nr:hypothetical protein CDL12_11080 [Handroanthus impetiginosus]
METFQAVIFRLAETHQNKPLTPAQRTILQDRLNHFVSQYKTPDHPPYSAMIERALLELNEKGGSSEQSISKFLEKEYNNLPQAHPAFLKHHLQKLCESGDVVVTGDKRYMLAGENLCLNSSIKVKRKRRRRKWRWDWDRERNRQRKKRLTKKSHQQKHEKVEVAEKNEESDKKEHRLAENGKERNQSEYNLPELSSPERTPGFESTTVENLPNLGSTRRLSVMNGTKLKGVEIYGWRRKTKSKQSGQLPTRRSARLLRQSSHLN